MNTLLNQVLEACRANNEGLAPGGYAWVFFPGKVLQAMPLNVTFDQFDNAIHTLAKRGLIKINPAPGPTGWLVARRDWYDASEIM